MTHVVQAGAEELIWIVVGLFWVIAQIAGGAAKKKRPPPSPIDDEDREAPDDPFADLMRKLSGVQEFKIPEPPGPPRSELRSATGEPQEQFVPENPWTPEEIGTLPDAKPLNRKPVTLEPVTEPVDVPEVDIRPTMSSFRSVMPSMKLPSMKLSFQTSEKSTKISPMLGNIINPSDKRTLRRAMLSHIIFSPPKALEGMK